MLYTHGWLLHPWGHSLLLLLCCTLCRSRELGELRAHLAQEKGTLEGLRKEVANTDERADKQVSMTTHYMLLLTQLYPRPDIGDGRRHAPRFHFHLE